MFLQVHMAWVNNVRVQFILIEVESQIFLILQVMGPQEILTAS